MRGLRRAWNRGDVNYRRRRDANEAAICKAVRAIPGHRITIQTIEGATSHKGQRLPKAGTPDLLVGFEGSTWVVEVKDASQLAKNRMTKTSTERLRRDFPEMAARFGTKSRVMSPAQLSWARDWSGRAVQCIWTARELSAVLGLCLTCGARCEGGLCEEHRE